VAKALKSESAKENGHEQFTRLRAKTKFWFSFFFA
jgi:hypothetical protein